MENRERRIRDRIHEHDVTMMRSYLEVDVAEWLSVNEVPFAYEAFTIPSVVGPDKDDWDNLVEAVREVGNFNRVEVDTPDGRVLDTVDILNIWDKIYQKHELENEVIGIPPRESLARFDKLLMLPDFAIYKDANINRADDDFDWGSFDYIVEVSGLYGVGIPDEATEDEWWDWYRASGVAFKELGYELLGLRDKVKWVVPNQPFIEGHSSGLSQEIRDDPNFTIMNTTQSGIELDELAREIGIDAVNASSNLSPPITPTKYKRPLQDEGDLQRGVITPIEYGFTGLNFGEVVDDPDAILAEDDFVIFYGDLGEVYLQDDHIHVRESEWRNVNMIMLREYLLNVLRELDKRGIVEGLHRVE